VDVLWGNGDGTFDGAVDYLAGDSVNTADVDGDGVLDLVVTNNGEDVGGLTVCWATAMEASACRSRRP
jgi:hypothetical protein